MEHVKNRFNLEKAENPELGDYIIACRVAVGMNYSDVEIGTLMKLVSDEDYKQSDRDELVLYLCELTKKELKKALKYKATK